MQPEEDAERDEGQEARTGTKDSTLTLSIIVKSPSKIAD
jgi:hypothetical protein